LCVSRSLFITWAVNWRRGSSPQTLFRRQEKRKNTEKICASAHSHEHVRCVRVRGRVCAVSVCEGGCASRSLLCVSTPLLCVSRSLLCVSRSLLCVSRSLLCCASVCMYVHVYVHVSVGLFRVLAGLFCVLVGPMWGYRHKRDLLTQKRPTDTQKRPTNTQKRPTDTRRHKRDLQTQESSCAGAI
jgi:hypothetical protein